MVWGRLADVYLDDDWPLFIYLFIYILSCLKRRKSGKWSTCLLSELKRNKETCEGIKPNFLQTSSNNGELNLLENWDRVDGGLGGLIYPSHKRIRTYLFQRLSLFLSPLQHWMPPLLLGTPVGVKGRAPTHTQSEKKKVKVW